MMFNTFGYPVTKKKDGNKYHAKKIIIDGITFDSQKEGARYIQLKAQLKAGVIKNLNLQVKFPIVPKKGKNKRIRYYIADFVYQDEKGNFIIEDVKSPITKKNPVYSLKKALVLAYYPMYDFREV